MNRNDYFFLLLTSKLGNPDRKPLTSSQLRLVTTRINQVSFQDGNEVLSMKHLRMLGLDDRLSSKILLLLDDLPLLQAYLKKAGHFQCAPITRNSPSYPLILRKRLGNESPGCLWGKGDCSLLTKPAISLVGSRRLNDKNAAFAHEAGYQAAKQGYVLVSGNAKGADIIAQQACIEAGGAVISVVADALTDHPLKKNILYLSEEEYDEPFSSIRALHRNRIIHCLGEITFAAQSNLGQGGTWSGCTHNLQNHWSPLYCFDDGSPAVIELERMGANLISQKELVGFSALHDNQICFF